MTNPAKIKIRPFEPTDVPAFAELSATRPALDADAAQRRAEIVEWIAFHNPEANGIDTVFVAEQGDQLVGHLCHMPTRFQIGARQVLASFWHDLYVHPDVRASGGQGFFTTMKLYRACETASPSFAAMIWTNEINVKLQRARKYKEYWFKRYRKRLDLDEKIDSSLRVPALARVGKPMARAALHAADVALTRTETRKHIAVERVDRFDERADRLAERIGPSLGVSPVKTSAYLNWKYLQRPHLDCAAYATIGRDGEMTGFIVCVRNEGNPRAGVIGDVSADPLDREIVVTLFDRASHHFRGRGVGFIDCVSTQPRFLSVMKKLLYVPRPPAQPLFIHKLDAVDESNLLADIANWHITLGDSEGEF